MRTVLAFASLLFITANASPAFSADSENEELQSLVDQLQEISTKARKERAADRWLLNALEDLVDRYNWPWRNELLTEDFSDGDYTQDPAWKVLSGQFWVDGRLGLRSRSQADADTPRQETQQKEEKQDLRGAVLGALLNQAFRSDRRREETKPEPVKPRRNEPAEIQLPLKIPSAFAVQIEFSVHNAPNENGQIEFSIYQGSESSSGYRLALYTGQRSSLELLSRRSGRTSVIDSVDLDDISDGSSHSLEWRRDANGQIEVLLDETQLMRTRDSSFRYPFKQLSIVNRGGDFAVGSIALHGGK